MTAPTATPTAQDDRDLLSLRSLGQRDAHDLRGALRLAGVPPMGTNETETDSLARVKFFTPWTGWTWWVTEWDDGDICWGYVESPICREWGTFRLSSLEAVRGPWGLLIECDLHTPPARVSTLPQGLIVG